MIDLFGEVPTKHIPMMPEEYKGKTGKGCGYTKSQPRQWTADELVWIENLRDEGYSNEEIGISTGRTPISIQIKLKLCNISISSSGASGKVFMDVVKILERLFIRSLVS